MSYLAILSFLSKWHLLHFCFLQNFEMYWINSSTKRSFLQGTLFSFQHAQNPFISYSLWAHIYDHLMQVLSDDTSDMQMIYRWYHCHDHLIWRTDSLVKTLMLGKFEDRRRRCNRGWDGWMASLTRWTWVWANSGRQWRTRKTGVLQFMGSQRVRDNRATEKQHYCIGSGLCQLRELLLSALI